MINYCPHFNYQWFSLSVQKDLLSSGWSPGTIRLKKFFKQNSGSLCRALASKPLMIQTWDWLRMKDFLKILKIDSIDIARDWKKRHRGSKKKHSMSAITIAYCGFWYTYLKVKMSCFNWFYCIGWYFSEWKVSNIWPTPLLAPHIFTV